MNYKREMFATLTDVVKAFPTIQTVEVIYDGSGDSGGIDSIDFRDGNNRLVDIGDGFNHVNNKIEEFVYQVLEERCGGWEINDGARGEVIIRVDRSEEISFNHYYRELTEVDSSFSIPAEDDAGEAV